MPKVWFMARGNMENIKKFENTYTISEVSQKIGVPISTIRYYDKNNLIPHLKRDEYNQRVFSEENIYMLQMVIGLKEIGVKLKDIAAYVKADESDNATLDFRYNFLVNQESNLKKQIISLQVAFTYLKFKEWYYKTSIEANDYRLHLLDNSMEMDPRSFDEYVKETGAFKNTAEFKKYLSKGNIDEFLVKKK